MGITKYIIKVPSKPDKVLDLADVKTGLASGAHTITIESYDGTTLLETKTRDFTIAAIDYDTDYQAVLDYATTNSISLPTGTQQYLDNQRMVDFKASGAYAKSDIVFNFESTASIAFKLICWKRKILAVSYGSPTWSNDGWLGNGTNTYIDPLYDTRTAGLNWVLNSAAVIWKSFSISSGNCIIGGFGAGGYTLVLPDGGSNSYSSINGSSAKVNSYGVLGLNMVSRESNVLTKYNNLDNSTASTSVWAEKLFIGARNRVDQGGQDNYSDEGIGFIAIGGAMFAEYAAIKTAING